MTRLQWLMLVLAVAAAAVLVGSWDRHADDGASTVGVSGGGEPDLYMENAVISQFDAVGNLRYKLQAAEISHFAERRVTHLRAPELTLLRDDGPPWIAHAAHGEVVYAANPPASPCNAPNQRNESVIKIHRTNAK